MRLTVLGSCAAYPAAGQACSGYLLEHNGFRLLLDAGFAVMPRLLELVGAQQVDAVVISHGHPDHCADLNPLLRARTMRSEPAAALDVYALPGALDAVLALDRPGLLDSAYNLHDLGPGKRFGIGPFDLSAVLLPHSVPNAGVRLEAGGKVLAYTGDCGPSPEVVRLAKDADLFLAEATFPSRATEFLSSAAGRAREAGEAGVAKLVLTHLSDPRYGVEAGHDGPVEVAAPGLAFEV